MFQESCFALLNEPLLDATESHTLAVESFLFLHHQFKPNHFSRSPNKLLRKRSSPRGPTCFTDQMKGDSQSRHPRSK